MNQNELWYCRAQGCRFKKLHTTLGHKCGLEGCQNPFGHGQMEHFCQKVDDFGYHGHEWTNVLFRCRDYKMPNNLQCTLRGCKFRWSHNKASHQCKKCLRYGEHTTSNCPIGDFHYAVLRWDLPEREICDFFNQYGDGYIEFYVGMGCTLYIKRHESEIKTMFLHSDAHGQYGPETSDLPTRDFFIRGLYNLTISWEEILQRGINGFGGPAGAASPDAGGGDVPINSIIKCPLCRNITDKSTIKFIKGLDAKCVVCLTNDIETYFPDCEHTPVCKQCLEKLD